MTHFMLEKMKCNEIILEKVRKGQRMTRIFIHLLVGVKIEAFYRKEVLKRFQKRKEKKIRKGAKRLSMRPKIPMMVKSSLRERQIGSGGS